MRTFEDILAEVQQQHPEEPFSQQRVRAEFRMAHINAPQPEVAPKVEDGPVVSITPPALHLPDYSVYFKAIIGILILLCLLSAKSAFGQLDGLQVQNSSGSVVKQWMGGIAKIKCSANAQCTVEGGVLTINPTQGGSGTTIPTCSNQVLTGNGTVMSCVSVSYANLANIPTEFTPAAHNQAISTITGLQTALDGKQAAGSYAAANASTTVNGQPCALGGSCTVADSTKVVANGAITGATKTKISYDAKGLVTAGADAATADIPDSTDKRYVTDAQRTAITHANRTALDAVSGTNTGDQDLSGLVLKTTTVAGKALSSNITIACADLSDDGDACSKSVGTGATNVAAGNHTHTELGAAFKKRPCEITITGSGTSGVLQDADDELGKCKNAYGATLTIESVQCWADTGSPTVMVGITGGADMLTGNITAGTFASPGTGTLNGAQTQLANGGLDFKIVSAGGAAHEITCAVGRTL